jgi:hypothetical protein
MNVRIEWKAENCLTSWATINISRSLWRVSELLSRKQREHAITRWPLLRNTTTSSSLYIHSSKIILPEKNCNARSNGTNLDMKTVFRYGERRLGFRNKSLLPTPCEVWRLEAHGGAVHGRRLLLTVTCEVRPLPTTTAQNDALQRQTCRPMQH